MYCAFAGTLTSPFGPAQAVDVHVLPLTGCSADAIDAACREASVLCQIATRLSASVGEVRGYVDARPRADSLLVVVENMESSLPEWVAAAGGALPLAAGVRALRHRLPCMQTGSIQVCRGNESSDWRLLTLTGSRRL